jgi:hypothetical protein
MRKRRLIAIAAAAITATATAIGLAPPALAYGPSYCNTSTCSLSNSANTSGFFFEMPRLTKVSMLCWTDSQWWNGTNRWFKVDSIYGQGYLIATQVSSQTTVGHC